MHFFFLFYTDDVDIRILRNSRKYTQVNATSPVCSLETLETALWGRQISLLFIHQTTWHYVPEGINLHKPFILLLTAFIFLSSSSESPMVQDRSSHKGADLWIYDRVSICFRSGPYGCLESGWLLEILCVEVKRSTGEFYYHHLTDDISTAESFSSTSPLQLRVVFIPLLGWKLACKVFVGKPEGKSKPSRSKREWKGNVQVDLKDIGWKHRLELPAQFRDKWRATVKGAMKHRVPLNAENFSTWWGTTVFQWVI
jgi:hypothetical protein